MRGCKMFDTIWDDDTSQDVGGCGSRRIYGSKIRGTTWRYDRRSYQFYGGRIYGVDDFTTLMRYGVTSYDIMIYDFTIYGVTIRMGADL